MSNSTAGLARGLAAAVLEELRSWKFMRHALDDMTDEESEEFSQDVERGIDRGLGLSEPHSTRFVSAITVTDPDTGGKVAVEICKDLVTGAMVGIDGSYLEQDVGPVHDPYNPGQRLSPKDEERP